MSFPSPFWEGDFVCPAWAFSKIQVSSGTLGWKTNPTRKTVTLYQVKKDATGTIQVKTAATKTVKVTVSDEYYKTYMAGFANPMTKQEKSTLYTGATDVDMAGLVVYGIDKAGNVVKLTPVADYDAELRNEQVGGAVLQGALVGAQPLVEAGLQCKIMRPPTTLAFVASDALSGQMIDIINGIAAKDGNNTLAIINILAGSENPLTDDDDIIYGDTLAIVEVDENQNYVQAYTVIALDQYGMSHFDKVTFGPDVVEFTADPADPHNWAVLGVDPYENAGVVTIASGTQTLQFTLTK